MLGEDGDHLLVIARLRFSRHTFLDGLRESRILTLDLDVGYVFANSSRDGAVVLLYWLLGTILLKDAVNNVRLSVFNLI